jgi:hypothetical protein
VESEAGSPAARLVDATRSKGGHLMQWPRGIRVLTLVVVLALVAAACGGDDGGSDDATTTTASSAGSDGEENATTTTAAPATTTTEAVVSGDSDSAWCRGLREASEETAGPGALDIMTATPEELGQAFEAVRDTFAEAADSAPPEIAGDVDVLLAFFETFVDKGNAAEWNLLALASDPEFAATFEDPSFEQAANRVDAYSREVCGVDFSTFADAGTAPPAPGGGDADEDDPVSIVLGTLGIPRALFTDEQIECVTEELGEEFVASVTPDWVPTPEAVEALAAAVDACDLDLG